MLVYFLTSFRCSSGDSSQIQTRPERTRKFSCLRKIFLSGDQSLCEVFASRDREKVYYIAGVLLIRGLTAKFFCLKRVRKFKGRRKSVLHSGRPTYPGSNLTGVYCITKNSSTCVLDNL